MNDSRGARERLFSNLRREIGNQRVLEAMEQVPREKFVPPSTQHMTYEDLPLPIGQGQTISQPFIVAIMISALELKGKEKVLEIGTGSGYEAAILSLLAQEVITVERLPGLAEAARLTLESLEYRNIHVYLGGEILGYPQEAPFDAIIVAAGAPRLPHELLDQMAPGGRLVIPIGSQQEQNLTKVVRTQEGHSLHSLGACRFVPLIGKGAWPED